MICPECYSDDARATPLTYSESCLSQHRQYICGTCGRCICYENDSHLNLNRWHFPFKTFKQALLFLRTADDCHKKPCGIYLIQDVNGRMSYKIFPDDCSLRHYLEKNKKKKCLTTTPLFQMPFYQDYDTTEIRYLKKEEVEKYLAERSVYLRYNKS